MADEESDKVRRTARDALNTVSGGDKVLCMCKCSI